MGSFPFLGSGLGLRTPHVAEILATRPNIDWFEAISENFLGLKNTSPGRPLAQLLRVREHYPIVLHGVSMSIGGTDPLDREYFRRLKKLYATVEPAWASDHLCWTGVHGRNLHDLMPLPFDRRTLKHVATRVQRAQEWLGRPLVVENVSSYLTYTRSDMTEWDFLAELARTTGCGLLVDVNNIYVSSVNHAFDAEAFLAALPKQSVAQIHLAGHSDAGTHLVDTHDEPICDEVWTLYASALRRWGPVSTLVEWDSNYPPFADLVALTARVRDSLSPPTATERSRRADEAPLPA